MFRLPDQAVQPVDVTPILHKPSTVNIFCGQHEFRIIARFSWSGIRTVALKRNSFDVAAFQETRYRGTSLISRSAIEIKVS